MRQGDDAIVPVAVVLPDLGCVRQNERMHLTLSVACPDDDAPRVLNWSGDVVGLFDRGGSIKKARQAAQLPFCHISQDMARRVHELNPSVDNHRWDGLEDGRHAWQQ